MLSIFGFAAADSHRLDSGYLERYAGEARMGRRRLVERTALAQDRITSGACDDIAYVW